MSCHCWVNKNKRGLEDDYASCIHLHGEKQRMTVELAQVATTLFQQFFKKKKKKKKIET